MPTLEEIQEQIRATEDPNQFLGRREVKELPNILWEDESVEKIVRGLYNNHIGILVATNKRLVFVDKGTFGRLTVEDFPYDKISSIQYETGWMFGKVTIFTSGNKAVIEQLLKKEAREFGDYVRARVSKVSQHASVIQPERDSSDAVDQIKRLAELRDQGVLTEEEFAAKKKQLLGI